MHITDTCPTQKEKKLKKIIKDIKKRVPLNAILMSEQIYSPEGKVRNNIILFPGELSSEKWGRGDVTEQ